MGTITLKKPRQAKVVEELDPLEILIEAAGAHLEQAEKSMQIIAAEQKKLAPYQAALKDLAEMLNGLGDADEAGQATSTNFVVSFKKRGLKRALVEGANAKILKLLGEKVFLQLAKVNLGDVDNYLTPPQKVDLIDDSKRGDRSFTIERLAK